MRPARHAFPVALLLLLAARGAQAGGGYPEGIPGIEEPSGVSRAGDVLLIVGDGDAARWYACPVSPGSRGLVPLPPAALVAHAVKARRHATDLEAVDALADGRVVVLSEDSRSLFDAGGVLVRYPENVREVDGRGLEGLAVRVAGGDTSEVAVLWEGGYLREGRTLSARRPRVLVHRVMAGVRARELGARDFDLDVELRVPEPAGAEPRAQRFRAPDLVWHTWTDHSSGSRVDGWIVLLSSGWGEPPDTGSVEECTSRNESGRPRRWCHRWLQRFTRDGSPSGEPFDLDPVLPEEVRFANWEGLGWFEPGRALVLVYDESVANRVVDPQQAFVLELPPGWE